MSASDHLSPSQFAYQTGHVAPGPDPEFPHSSMDDPSGILPDYPHDLKTAVHWYGTPSNPAMSRESHQAIISARGNPEAQVKVYRALPAEHGKTINPGDWVTPSRRYAEQHRQSNGKSNWVIAEKTVSAGHLYGEGDMHEWGWHPT